MTLEIPKKWKFDEPTFKLPSGVRAEFSRLIERTVQNCDSPYVAYHIIKSRFGDHSKSSDLSWAEGDMDRAISREENAALYIKKMYDAFEELGEQCKCDVPEVSKFNLILRKFNIPVEIDGNCLREVVVDAQFVDTPKQTFETTPAFQSKYSIGDLIGHGGFGDVHRVVRHTSVGEFEYAMKILNPSPSNPNREKAAIRFSREIRAISRLRHSGIVQYIDAGIMVDGRSYLVMPLIEGVDLQRHCSGKSPKYVIPVFHKVLRAVEYAHSKDILHRDLKPSNVLVQESDEHPIVLDFGCAYLADDTDNSLESLTTSFVGTMAYTPPEVLQNRKLRIEQHDVYALGVTFYQSIANSLPNPEQYEPLSEISTQFAVIDDVLKKAMAQARSDRFQSITDFRLAIEGVGGQWC